MINIWFDGACEPKNPGGACGMGYVIKRDDKLLFEKGDFLPADPSNSNNVAEYIALNSALRYCLNHPDEIRGHEIECRGDSKLVIEQMFGNWRIKSGAYVPYARQCISLIEKIGRYKVSGIWIPREQNSKADELSKREMKRSGVKFKIQPDV